MAWFDKLAAGLQAWFTKFREEFVLNFILNMINSKKSFSKIDTVTDLQKRLLFGSSFSRSDEIFLSFIITHCDTFVKGTT